MASLMSWLLLGSEVPGVTSNGVAFLLLSLTLPFIARSHNRVPPSLGLTDEALTGFFLHAIP